MVERMKVKCLECEESFDLDKNEFEEGDPTECPECLAGYTIKVKGGRFHLASEREKYEEYDLAQFGDETYEDD
jgi:Zn finger protein HypA/HybF involved in hydrogenase expression